MFAKSLKSGMRNGSVSVTGSGPHRFPDPDMHHFQDPYPHSTSSFPDLYLHHLPDPDLRWFPDTDLRHILDPDQHCFGEGLKCKKKPSTIGTFRTLESHTRRTEEEYTVGTLVFVLFMALQVYATCFTIVYTEETTFTVPHSDTTTLTSPPSPSNARATEILTSKLESWSMEIYRNNPYYLFLRILD